ncbi:MAG: cellulase family glycosylhydrolase [Bacteroidales bacterium]|nr:cellulase family glycosylhydrolase [Bacteroidales bacterium]
MKKLLKPILMVLAGMMLFSGNQANAQKPRDIWTPKQANEWYQQWGWLRGCDFLPSTAINQLEMWQAETFDPATIDRELGWAEGLGLNTMRVYLHHVAWQVDPTGFKKRIGKYLSIAQKHGISTVFVIFDDCWRHEYQAGKQPDPILGRHNSGWVTDPGDLIHKDSTLNVLLEKYVKDILTTFKKDKRIILWDVYNEPGNGGYGEKSMPLLKNVFRWGREVNPSQPLSAGVWSLELPAFCQYQVANSDVITYHNYNNEVNHKAAIDSLRKYGRPLICTEYMARKQGSRFDNIMPLLKAENVAAINWGFVSGKSNTIYAWGDRTHTDGSEPELWFHDILRKDGTPFRQAEVDLIRKLTGK